VARDLLYGLVSGTSNRNRLTDAAQLLNLAIPRPPARGDQNALASVRQRAENSRGAAALAAAEAAALAAATWVIDVGESVVDVSDRAAAHEAAESEVVG
jgi:hypothetical protein